MKTKKIVLLCLLICFSLSLFAQEKQEEKQLFNDETISAYAEPDLRHWANSILEVTLMHLTLNFYNRAIAKQLYGNITTDTMLENLKTPWVWDNDEFYINQLYHPYQGSMYFVAGRANGLNFWQSLVPTMYGVLTWEYLMECEVQSVNDLIITNLSGAYVGEILHRSYQQLEDVCLPVAFIISPFDAITRFTTGQKSPRVIGTVQSFDVKTGGSFIAANQFTAGNPDYNICDHANTTYENVAAYNKTFGLSLGFDYVYGNRYGHNTVEPLDQFNLSFNFLGKPGHFFYSIISDGLIVSKALNTECDSTIGISYNFDYIMASDLNYNNNAIGFTFAQKYDLKNLKNSSIKWSANVAFAVDGCSEFYYLHSIYKRYSDDGQEQRLYDIGFGPNVKLDFKFESPVAGNVFFNGFASWYYNPSFTETVDGTTGSNFIAMANFGYEHQLYKAWSLGLSELLYFKYGNYNGIDNVTHKISHTNLYVKYKLK